MNNWPPASIDSLPLHAQLRRYVCWLAGEGAFHEIVAAAGFPPGHFDDACPPHPGDLAVLMAKAALRLGFAPAGLQAEVQCWSRMAVAGRQPVLAQIAPSTAAHPNSGPSPVVRGGK